jgi:hypothetical protein
VAARRGIATPAHPRGNSGDVAVTAREVELAVSARAADAGFSKRQKVTAVRVASIPEEEFERAACHAEMHGSLMAARTAARPSRRMRRE